MRGEWEGDWGMSGRESEARAAAGGGVSSP